MQAGFHTFCLKLPLEAVPEGDWCCPKHVKQRSSARVQATTARQQDATSDLISETHTQDITEDENTLQYLKEHHSSPDSSDTDKARIMRKASRYLWQNEVLLHKETLKPLPSTADRQGHCFSMPQAGSFCVQRTSSLVQQSDWWCRLTQFAKDVVRDGEQCKLVLHSFRDCQVCLSKGRH